MKPCSWDRVLVQLFLLATTTINPSAAVPAFINPSVADLTARISTRIAAYSSDLQFTYPTFSSLKAGSTVNITWTGDSGPSLLTLQDVNDNRLTDANIIASDITVGSLMWTPSADTAGAYHSLRLEDQISGTVVYSDIFRILLEEDTDRGTSAVTQSRLSIVAREPAPSHPDISTSAKIWVGVGSALIVLSVIGGIVVYQYFCRRKQRKLLALSSRSSSSDPFFRDAMPQVEVPEKVHVRPRECMEVRTGLQ
ncbi:hypothetical protein BUE80_DR011112 [Diplocarpon rosae]|nr:hypothetical protein BUE80_DR011112 [Diplocarpon rosae]